jgi:hypothetical protein
MQEVNSHKRAGSKMRDIVETDTQKPKKKKKQSKIEKRKGKEHIQLANK